MCDQCDASGEKTPSGGGFRLSRRAFLALVAGAGGAALSQVSCQPEKGKERVATAASKPIVTTGHATTLAASAPATEGAATTAASGPAPDLGATLFPDAQGNPIATAADCPVLVIPRRDWTTHRPNFHQMQLMNGISRVTVHHTGWNLSTDAWKPTTDDLENIREFHSGGKTTDRGWADIAYHFVIDRAGRVWQARPLVYQGAHAKDHNAHNLGICLLGNFDVQMPAAAQLWSLATFIPFLRGLYGIELGQVYTHRELRQTECPGKHLQGYMDRVRVKWGRER
ncbi:MAG TPA: peptidoglycan recognition family protein [Phycisphaerae bacterium]|nr:peptidoglycan recognition family protein [Phycisphaerae bacterium]